MKASIQLIPEMTLIGQKMKMSFSNNNTIELWKSFMPREKVINNFKNNDLISMQQYDSPFDFLNPDPNTSFYKWAAVEAFVAENKPARMETIKNPKGLFVVFNYIGFHSDPAIILNTSLQID